MKLDNRDLVLRGILGILPTHLGRYARTVLGGRCSPAALRRLLAGSGPLPEAPDLADLSTQIRVLTARGGDGRLLLPLPPGLGARLHEVRRFRNEAVHGRPFDADRTLAALVAVSETLRLIEAPERGRTDLRELISAIGGGRGARHSPLDAVGITVRCPPVVGYAHAVAGVPLTLSLCLSLPGAAADHEPQPADEDGRWRLLSSGADDAQEGPRGDVEVRVSVVEDGGGREVTQPWHLVWDTARPQLRETCSADLVRDSLLQVDRTGSAHVRVELRSGEGTVTVRRLPGLELLAPRQWRLAGGRHWSGAALATFVQPDQAAVAALAAEAASVLADRGAPSGAGRPDALAEAVCTVLRRRRLGVEAPPGRWDAGVHPVRPADELLETDDASALDATVLLAGVLEHLGVATTLLLTPDSAFLGYQREAGAQGAAGARSPGGLASTASAPAAAARPASPQEVVSLVRRGAMGLVDPALVARTAAAVLDRLNAPARSLALEALSDLVLAVPVEAARSQGVAPQPGLERDEDDVVTEVAVPAQAVGDDEAVEPVGPAGACGDGGAQGAGRAGAAGDLAAPVAAGGPPADVVVPDVPAEVPGGPAAGAAGGARGPGWASGGAGLPAPPRVEEWRRSLLDLSPRNPLIDRTSRHAVELRVPPGLVGRLEDIVNQGVPVALRASTRATTGGAGADAHPQPGALTEGHPTVDVGLGARDYDSRLQSLAASARTTLEGTGANNLYLALGTLVWRCDGRRLRSPLVLVPVSLVREDGTYGITLDEAGASTPNYSLLARFETDTGINLTELGEPVHDAHGIDLDATVERLRRRLRHEGRDDVVETTAHLGMFRFSTYRMWHDLGEHWPTITANPLVSHLLEDPGTAFADPAAVGGAPHDTGRSGRGSADGAGATGGADGASGDSQADGVGSLDEVVENLPLAADANQARVVDEAASGRSLVVDGPPGTGKSQTVANLVFRALASGRSIMFVAEKASALDVVARRLREDAGVGDLLLNLHDDGMRPAEVREALRRALELSVPAGVPGVSGGRGGAGGGDGHASGGPGTTSAPGATDPAGPPAAAGGPEALRRRLAALRGRLEAYRQSLHVPGAQGVSYYRARQDLVEARGSGSDLEAAQAAFEAAASETGLAAFDPAGHASLLDDYRHTLEQLRAALAPELLEAVLTRRDEILAQAGQRAEELRHELGRRRGTRSVRALVDAYGDLVTAITPCVLVSPDSVARFFPADRCYVDIVVFDEASQITVAGAVGAMGRGRSVVVVGDPRQMPPPAHPGGGATAGAGGAGPQEVDSLRGRSVLDRCLAGGVPRRSLTWHYRSQVESLIAFSNRHYYGGALRSFPSPLTMAARADDGPGGHGVSLRRVEGTYYRAQPSTRRPGIVPNTNPVEAYQVVEEVRRRFESSPQATPSLGVITFNSRQRDLIEARLRETGSQRILRALEERDGLFVRNLDNVQGEERDTILFSVAFSANERGDVPLNLGSLGHAGGERRLNVAVTRARRQVVVFTSFDPEDLHAERSAHQGIRDLRAYLEMARDGRAPRAQPWSSSVVDLHRNEVAERLREAGLEVSVGVGHSSFEIDLVLAAPGRPEAPAVAVLLDGPGWNGRGSIADRDLLPADVLRRVMGWEHVERVWAPEWVADEGSVVTRLVAVAGRSAAGLGAVPGREVLEPPRPPVLAEPSGPSQEPRAGEQPEGAGGPGSPGAPGSPQEPTVPEAPGGQETGSPSRGVDPAEGAALPTAAVCVDYQEWRPEGVRPLDVLDRADSDEEARAQVIEVARAICDVESPLTRHRLVVMLCRAFGLSRVARVREERVRLVLGEAFAYVDEHDFVWRTRDRALLPPTYRRNALDHVGSIEEIHPRELVALMADVRAACPEWTSPEDLCKRALRRLSARSRQLGARGVLPALTRALEEAERAQGAGVALARRWEEPGQGAPSL